jgi:hypothetical protein
MKKIIIIFIGIIGFITIFIGGYLFVNRNPPERALVVDLYIINNYLVIEGVHIDEIIIRDLNNNKIYLKNTTDETAVVETNYLQEDSYSFKVYHSQIKNTLLEINNNVYEANYDDVNKIITLIKSQKSIQHDIYNNIQTNTINKNFIISDFNYVESSIYISLTTEIDADVYVGFSNESTIYTYEMVKQRQYSDYKKNIYKINIGEDNIENIAFFSRILPIGDDKANVESTILYFNEIISDNHETIIEDINIDNNIKII